MDEILKLAKYLTLHIAAMDAKFGFHFTNITVHGITASRDVYKLLDIAKLLDEEIRIYLEGGNNVSKS